MIRWLSGAALWGSMKDQTQRRACPWKHWEVQGVNKSSASNFSVRKRVNLWPTWIALCYSVDVGSVEDTDTCASSILHAHAYAEEQSSHGAHQEHHAEDDARNCSAPGTNTHNVSFIGVGFYNARVTITGVGCKASNNKKGLTVQTQLCWIKGVAGVKGRRGASGTLKDSWCEN